MPKNKKTKRQIALLNLRRWKQLCIIDKYYIFALTPEQLDVIDDEICNPTQRGRNTTIMLERAKGKDGEGTGKMEKVTLGDIIARLETDKFE